MFRGCPSLFFSNLTELATSRPAGGAAKPPAQGAAQGELAQKGKHVDNDKHKKSESEDSDDHDNAPEPEIFKVMLLFLEHVRWSPPGEFKPYFRFALVTGLVGSLGVLSIRHCWAAPGLHPSHAPNLEQLR
jgi:hypothetical protein